MIKDNRTCLLERMTNLSKGFSNLHSTEDADFSVQNKKLFEAFDNKFSALNKNVSNPIK